MSGMTTLIKVRDGITIHKNPGRYENSAGTEAERATSEQLRHDGIQL